MEFIDLNQHTLRHPHSWDLNFTNGSTCWPPALIHEEFRPLLTFVAFILLTVTSVSSALVIAAVSLHTDLDTPHHHVIRALAVLDLLAVPVDLLPGMLRLTLARFNVFELGVICVLLNHLSVLTRALHISYLTLLCVDRFIQINFGEFYLNYIDNSVNLVGFFIMTTFPNVVVDFSLVQTMIDERVLSEGTGNNCFQCYSFSAMKSINRKIILIYDVVCLVISFVVCIQISIVYFRTRKTFTLENFNNAQTIKSTIALTTMFCFYFLPTPIYFYAADSIYKRTDEFSKRTLDYTLIKMIRHLSHVCTGVVLFLSSQVYKETFRIFLSSHPRAWRHLLRRRMYTRRVNVLRQANLAKRMRRQRFLTSSSDISTVTLDSLIVERHRFHHRHRDYLIEKMFPSPQSSIDNVLPDIESEEAPTTQVPTTQRFRTTHSSLATTSLGTSKD